MLTPKKTGNGVVWSEPKVSLEHLSPRPRPKPKPEPVKDTDKK